MKAGNRLSGGIAQETAANFKYTHALGAALQIDGQRANQSANQAAQAGQMFGAAGISIRPWGAGAGMLS